MLGLLLMALVVLSIAYDTRNFTTIRDFLTILEMTNNITDRELEKLFE
jgi:hypothetical protein